MMQAAKYRPLRHAVAGWKLVSVVAGRDPFLALFRNTRPNEECGRWRSLNGMRKSRPSRRRLPPSRSQIEFAVGARTGVLARALVLQVVVVTAVGIVVGVGGYALVTGGGRIGGLTLRFEPMLAAVWSIGFLVLAVVGSLASLRRVLRIDPIDATTGAGA